LVYLNVKIVEDPDNWESSYTHPGERLHGTSMASLIIYDELDATKAPINRKIYVRPIMQPDHKDTFSVNDGQPRHLKIPENVLTVDYIHRVIKRLFEGENGIKASAPGVKIINFSIAEKTRTYEGLVSPLARLFDWLSYKYNVLFIISAGNYDENLEFEISHQEFVSLKQNPTQLAELALNKIKNLMFDRRLRSPAESMNALTIGSLHHDFSNRSNLSPNFIDFFTDPMLELLIPSPINAVGPGINGSIKPEILLPGGRVYYLESLTTSSNKILLRINTSESRFGQRVAAPAIKSGSLNNTTYTRGTSNATAIASRNAIQLYEVLSSLKNEVGDEGIDEAYFPVLIKTLLVHGASWGESKEILQKSLPAKTSHLVKKDFCSRLIGFGSQNIDRVLECTSKRVTLLGWGNIRAEAADKYEFPLPQCLISKPIKKRLIVTLAWFTPVNPSHSSYRQAHLWVSLWR